jgi:hypothetical protein
LQCLQSPQKFCYICGSYVFDSKLRQIDSFVKKLYFSYFQLKVGDQDKSFAPHIACNTCVEGLRYWYDGKRKAMPFAILMQWRERKNNYDDCYFCVVNLTGYNKNNKKGIKYPNLLSAIRPVSHGPELPVPSPPGNLKWRIWKKFLAIGHWRNVFRATSLWQTNRQVYSIRIEWSHKEITAHQRK